MVETSDDALVTNKSVFDAYASYYGMKGFRVVPFLDKKTTEADIVNMYVRSKKPSESVISSRDGQPRRLADGAKLTQVQSTAKDTKGRLLEQYAFEYYVTKQRFKQPDYSLQEDMRDLTGMICNMIEQDAVTKLKGEATATKATGLNKNWNRENITLDHIQSDLVDIDEAYDDDELLYNLNTIFHSKKGLGSLIKKIEVNKQNWEIPKEGYDSQKELQFGTQGHLYGGNKLSPGEILGWDRNRPAAAIYYGIQEGLTQPEVYEQLSSFAPIIQTYVEEVPGINPEYKIQIGASWAIVVREPNGVLFDNGFIDTSI